MADNKLFFWIGFICMLEWGLIHIFAGSITVYQAYKPDIPALLSGICSGAPESIVQEAGAVSTWNDMNVRILIQHGLNLFFVGVWATGVAIVLLLGKDGPISQSLFLACIWPWCADIAYFWAIDTVNYGVALTETQTIIVSIGTWCIGRLVQTEYPTEIGSLQSAAMTLLPFGLIACSAVNKAVEIGGKHSDYTEL